jgi:hypothetical protein
MVDRRTDLEARLYLSTLALPGLNAGKETITVVQGAPR